MTLNPNFREAVLRLHPGVSFRTDVILQDNSDGKGVFLVSWNLPGNPPTDAEIAAAMLLPFPPLPQQAQEALAQAKDVALQCLVFGVPYPADWQSYANTLVTVSSTSSSLPVKPPLPPIPTVSVISSTLALTG